jgi:flagellar biosynthesis protein
MSLQPPKHPPVPPFGLAQQAPEPRAGLRLQAVALEYSLHPAPVVIARGEGNLAREILRRAQEQGVWIAQDPQLVALLSRVDLEREIPPELYAAVAVILSWVYWLRGLQPGDEGREQRNT